MAMSTLASAEWTSYVWNQWSDDRVVKEEMQYSSISNWREANRVSAMEKQVNLKQMKVDVLKDSITKDEIQKDAPIEKFQKSTTVVSSTGITKIARVQKVSYTKKPKGLNMRGEVLIGNTHQRLTFDQMIPYDSKLKNLKVYDFVTITFKTVDGYIGGRGTKTITEVVSLA